MKVVLDTNILISAIVFGGKPRTILELIVMERKITGITSKFALNELLGILEIKFKYSQDQLDRVEKLIEENFTIVNPQNIPKIIKEDICDNQFLAILNDITVDFIISGDQHLSKIKMYRNVPIVTTTYFIDKILNK